VREAHFEDFEVGAGHGGGVRLRWGICDCILWPEVGGVVTAKTVQAVMLRR
jgi:hypothetical protein